jgi:L-ribulose-5-phosphate 4-epimerase
MLANEQMGVTMSFQPTSEKLMPDLSPREEIVLLARTLWREGYNDHLAGHITYNLGDDTLFCNPWHLLWNEFRAHDVIRIDLEGNVLEGDWPVPPGIPLHLQLHKLRPGVHWAMHNHPVFGTVWADMGEVPPAMDQSSSLGGGELVLVDEYDGAVNDANSARKAVEKMGTAELALLAGHGVFVLGNSARAVHQRAVALEQRCKHAWHIRAAGNQLVPALPQSYRERMKASQGDNFIGFWEAMVRQELREDPRLLD